MREDHQAVIRGMPGKVYENVNAVVSDLFRDRRITLPQSGIPVIRKRFDPLRHPVRLLEFRVAEYLHLGFVMGPEQRLDKVGAGVAPEIRRDIADPEAFSRNLLIGVRQNLPSQRFRMGLVPGAVLLEHPFREMLRIRASDIFEAPEVAILQGEEEIAMRLVVSRPDLHGFSVIGRGILQSAQVIHGIAHVVVRLRIVGPDIHGFAVIIDRLSCAALVVHHDAEVVIRLRMIRIDLNRLFVTGN